MHKRHLLPLLLISIFSTNAAGQSEKECLDFLYASMPQPDKVDYTKAFYEENVASTLRARREMPWGTTIPQREFMHFVLPVRVNNENMDSSRVVFYDELKDRVRHLTMTEAVLEVNHWCHEKVTYTPSDERTSSPLASVRTAYGRCGEESTFLVAALRSVCIPARQVYTPRWAHTDDNHAWVEAWADGAWHFLGACEPEAVLDLGWFNAPASRGMLMHTKAFGNYDGPEEVMQRTPCFTEIDVTSNYAPVAQRIVKVVDTEGRAVAGATVEFKIYNYAEFYTVSKKQTQADGTTYMKAGRGDLLAWAYKDGKYGFARCTMTAGDTLQVVLSHASGERFSADLMIVPPAERNTVPYMTDGQRNINAARLVREDSIRNAYVATFPQTADEFVRKSRGNYMTIRGASPVLLATLNDKDLRDVTADVLRDNEDNSAANKGYPVDIYNKYVLCPRVAYEKLVPYKGYFNKKLTSKEKKRFADIDRFVGWIKKNIKTDETSNPQHLRMTPIGVWESRLCDAYSRNIFFVALSRTLGNAARIDPVTQKVEYYLDGQWIEVSFGEKAHGTSSSKGTLKASYTPDEYVLNPKYYSHFTLSTLTGGVPSLLNYAEDDTWQSTLAGEGATLDTGDYLLTSGTRMADGSVLVHLEIAPVVEGQTTTVPLLLPHSDDGLQVIGNFNSEDIYEDELAGRKSVLSTTGRGYYVLGMIAPNNEPTNHTLRDIAAVRADYESLGVKTILLFRDAEAKGRFNSKDFPALPADTHLGTDVDGKIWDEITTNMHLTSSTLPVFIIADTFNRIVFISQGYTIGLGERLVKNLKSLK